MVNPMKLTGKQVLITGATSGIGIETTILLNKLGAKVILIDESEEKLQEIIKLLHGEDNAYYAFDLTQNEEIEPALKEITKKHGAMDGLAFCAGIGGVRPLSLTKHSFLHAMMNANVYSFVELVRCITRKNSFVKGGSIVVLSSVSSIKGLKSKTAYSASKAALDATVRCMAAELSDKKIRVNSILKGGVETDTHKDYLKNIMDLDESNDLKKQVLGIIQPGEIANLIAFLISDATATITGTSIVFDGGYTL